MAKFTRRRFKKRPRLVKRRRFTRSRRRKSFAGGASFYSKRIKPVRKYNRGKLRLQRALMRGGSLPFQTDTHVYYRGLKNTSESTNANRVSNVDMMAMYDDLSACDQTFILNKLGGPTIAANSIETPQYNNASHGKFSYQDMWSHMYSEALVMGSKIVVHVRRP